MLGGAAFEGLGVVESGEAVMKTGCGGVLLNGGENGFGVLGNEGADGRKRTLESGRAGSDEDRL